jgi:hypothetical protein
MPGLFLSVKIKHHKILPFMKKKTRLNFKAALTIFGFAAALLYGFTASAGLVPDDEEKPARKSKFRLKTFNSLNNNSVRIYPDVIKREMHVVAKDRKEIDFFVFDIEGTMLHHYKMKDKDHYKISGLARGTYIYRVFTGDIETATGDFQIR